MMLINPFVFGGAPPVGYSVMQAHGGATLSGGDRTVTMINNAAHRGRSSVALTGKTYIELTVTAGLLYMLGVSNENTNYAWNTDAGNCAFWYNGSGALFGSASGTAPANGSLGSSNIGMAIDPVAKKVWFRRGSDGAWMNGDPVAGTNGMSYASMSGSEVRVACDNGGAGSNTITLAYNLGQSAFAWSVPSGYAAGIPA